MNIEDIKIIDNNTKDNKSKDNNSEKTNNKQEKKKKIPGVDFGFKKGQSGNPKGRPKGTYSFIPLLKRELQKLDGMTDKTKGEVVIEKLIDKAIKDKDIQAMRELMNRIDGMPTQRIGGDSDNPIELKLTGDEQSKINKFIGRYLGNTKGQEE